MRIRMTIIVMVGNADDKDFADDDEKGADDEEGLVKPASEDKLVAMAQLFHTSDIDQLTSL